MLDNAPVSNLRIGLIVPSSNTVIEVDFYRGLPDGFTLHTARMYLEETTVQGESRMLDEFVMPAAEMLRTARPHVVVFGCTSAGALRGNDYDDQLCREISKVTGAPTVSVIHAVRNTMQNLQARRAVVITPYIDELNQRIRASLEADGLEILRIVGLGISDNFMISQVPGSEIMALAEKAVEGLSPDVLFASCTNFPAVRILSQLRQRFPFPVVSSNQIALEEAILVARNTAGVTV
jgi:maleate isomerase